MLDKLIPVSGENSIRQVVASVYTRSPLIDSKRFEKYLSQLQYQKFELVHSKILTFNLNNGESKDINQSPREVGFRMINYKEGRINKLISVDQRSTENKDMTQFSYYSLMYPKWENFKESLLNDFKTISSEDNPFISAISLNYSNEFLWNSDDEIVIDEIFDKSAEFMPKFFNSQNSSFLINTENETNDYKSIDKLEIVVSHKKKTIQTNSQVIFELKKSIKFNDSIIDGNLSIFFEEIHTDIKSTLRKLFTAEVKQKINLI